VARLEVAGIATDGRLSPPLRRTEAALLVAPEGTPILLISSQ
jgi:hypothetical protein